MHISVLGTGMMGAALARRLIEVGHGVTVYNRTAAKASALVELGATLAATPSEAMEHADAVVLAMADADGVQQVLLAPAVIASLANRRIVCVTTTSEDEIAGLATAVAAHGGALAEVSVMVGPDDVIGGRGQFIIGCGEDDQALWQDIFAQAGEWVFRAGEVGAASRCDKAFIAPFVFNMLGIAYAAAVGDKLGVPPAILTRILTESPVLAVTGAGQVLPLIQARAYATVIANVDAMRYAIMLLMESAKEHGVATAVLDSIMQTYDRAAAAGFAQDDAAAVYEVLIGP